MKIESITDLWEFEEKAVDSGVCDTWRWGSVHYIVAEIGGEFWRTEYRSHVVDGVDSYDAPWDAWRVRKVTRTVEEWADMPDDETPPKLVNASDDFQDRHVACGMPWRECPCWIPPEDEAPPKLVNASAKSVTSPEGDPET